MNLYIRLLCNYVGVYFSFIHVQKSDCTSEVDICLMTLDGYKMH